MQEGIELITSTGPSFAELDRTPDDHDRTVVERPESSERRILIDHNEEEDDDDDFEFTFDHESDWFPPGEVFPIFDRRLLSDSDAISIENDQLQIVQSAIKKLFIADTPNANNLKNDDDEDADLNTITPGTYCVWTPGNSPQASPARCKKSSSTGTTTTMAKRWGISLKEMLIRRSKSDGKKSLVRFVSLKKKSSVNKNKDGAATAENGNKNKAASGGGEKRWATYLPYRKAIIGFGFYPNVN